MSAGNALTKLLRYKAWADDCLYMSLAKLPDAVLTAQQPIIFGSILRTLNHVYAMDLVWKAHLEGTTHGFTSRNPDDCPTFDQLQTDQRTIDDWYLDYAEVLQPDHGREVLEIAFIGGGGAPMSRTEILQHVVNHTTYHRGHIADMVYPIPAKPPVTDFPVFLRETAG